MSDKAFSVEMRVTVENIPSSASLAQKNQNAQSVGATKVVLYNYAAQRHPDHPSPKHHTPPRESWEAVCVGETDAWSPE